MYTLQVTCMGRKEEREGVSYHEHLKKCENPHLIKLHS